MSDSSVIPPSPSAADYAAGYDRPLIPDASDPFQLMESWLGEAGETETNDANAMALATVDEEGLPDVRIVLLKGVSSEGLSFFTNYDSAKGKQLDANPVAALNFHWKSLRRQIRLRGTVTRLGSAQSTAYFRSRAAQSRISAIASDQSRPLISRDLLERRINELSAIYGDDDDIPRPPHWGGYLFVPRVIEFWQEQAFRLHDRLYFSRSTPDAAWYTQRLYP